MGMPKGQFEIFVGETSVEDNVRMITETVVLALDGKNTMLPYMDRVIKILPDIKKILPAYLAKDPGRTPCLPNGEYEALYPRVEELLTRRLWEAAGAIQEKVTRFEGLVREKLTAAVRQMLALFELQYTDRQICNCYLGFYNPFPRSVLTREYWLHYDISDEVFLRASLHEINHMLLFDKWKALHGYEGEKEPDYPDILWFLEELAIEPTLNDERIQGLIPIRHEAYGSLRAVEIAGKPLTTHIQEIYDARDSMGTFLEEAYHFLQSHCAELG